MYRDTRWAKALIAAQKEDGLWGNFHSMAAPYTEFTSEYALRRLALLGFTAADEPIGRALAAMEDFLAGKRTLPDRREKTHDWDQFMEMVVAAWVRRFTGDSPRANRVAEQWGLVLAETFRRGSYNPSRYRAAFEEVFGKKLWGDRFLDFATFYQVSLTRDQLDRDTENQVVDYLLRHETGIYYIYGQPICKLPETFASKQATRYLGALELLAGYRQSLGQLTFAADWLEQNRNENGGWDLGPTVSDKVYFPLSDSWRPRGSREADCTYRVQKLLHALGRCGVR